MTQTTDQSENKDTEPARSWPAASEPPPSREQIRRELGWELIQAERGHVVRD